MLHRAAYRALGLDGWTYDAALVEPAGFAHHVGGLDADWVGVSVTMPLKEAALALATTSTDLARRSGAANTLVRHEDPALGWHADNTDVEGIVRAIRETGAAQGRRHLVVVGSGATGRSAVEAAVLMDVPRVTFMVRDELRPETLVHARALGLDVSVVTVGDWPDDCDLVVSTIPPAAASGWAPSLPGSVAVLLDAVYGVERSPLLEAAASRDGTVAVPGTSMLLHQAARQVELMTGQSAPVEAMRAALTEAVTGRRAGPTR